jgi:hypothetical protein
MTEHIGPLDAAELLKLVIVDGAGNPIRKPIVTLQMADGALRDLAEVSDLLSCLQDLFGPIPAEPVLGPGILDITYQEIALPATSHGAAPGKILLPQLHCVLDTDGENAAIANAYAAKVTAYNARITVLQGIITSVLPVLTANSQVKVS